MISIQCPVSFERSFIELEKPSQKLITVHKIVFCFKLIASNVIFLFDIYFKVKRLICWYQAHELTVSFGMFSITFWLMVRRKIEHPK